MDAIEMYIQRESALEKMMKSFIENYQGKNGEAINALADKINHMCNNIGCPISVRPMLLSISARKIKKWGDDYDNKGKQLTGTSQWILDKYYQEKNGKHKILVGHFRWNHQGYMIDRDDAEYILAFFF